MSVDIGDSLAFDPDTLCGPRNETIPVPFIWIGMSGFPSRLEWFRTKNGGSLRFQGRARAGLAAKAVFSAGGADASLEAVARFARELAVSPARFRRQIRLERARQMLSSSEASVTEATIATGFRFTMLCRKLGFIACSERWLALICNVYLR